jgi:hypothetical protein
MSDTAIVQTRQLTLVLPASQKNELLYMVNRQQTIAAEVSDLRRQAEILDNDLRAWQGYAAMRVREWIKGELPDEYLTKSFQVSPDGNIIFSEGEQDGDGAVVGDS